MTTQESVAHRCMVIGEDLGTVPENFRETLADWGILSYQVMMFERLRGGTFRSLGQSGWWLITSAAIETAILTFVLFAGAQFGERFDADRGLGSPP